MHSDSCAAKDTPPLSASTAVIAVVPLLTTTTAVIATAVLLRRARAAVSQDAARTIMDSLMMGAIALTVAMMTTWRILSSRNFLLFFFSSFFLFFFSSFFPLLFAS